jgi:hypothetical protein
MAAKNKHRPIGYDLQNAFAAHVEASAKAHEWAEKCLAFRQSGKTDQAKAAENQAKRWLRRMILLEAAAAHGKSQGGRPSRG